MASILPP